MNNDHNNIDHMNIGYNNINYENIDYMNINYNNKMIQRIYSLKNGKNNDGVNL